MSMTKAVEEVGASPTSSRISMAVTVDGKTGCPATANVPSGRTSAGSTVGGWLAGWNTTASRSTPAHVPCSRNWTVSGRS